MHKKVLPSFFFLSIKMAQFAATFANHVPEDDDWGSDFEGELCSQEIEDNKINEIREANLLRNSPNDARVLVEDNSQTVQTITGNRIVNTTTTGAIPKSGFSYLSNIVNKDNKTLWTIGNESENNIHPQRQASQSEDQSTKASMNSDNSTMQPYTEIVSNNGMVTKKTPRKLKPEAFSFLNNLSQINVFENSSGTSKERKTLVPTAFSNAEKLDFSQSQDNTNMILNRISEEFVNVIPTAPSLENMTSNYESITEDSFSEFASAPGNVTGKENVIPPLPARPPPVFKYPPETFSPSRPISIESTSNLAISQPLLQSVPIFPKLGHSISSPDSAIFQPILQSVPAYPKFGHSVSLLDSGLKSSNGPTQDKILNKKVNNRKSLPSIPICPGAPKRPLPPLPMANTDTVSKIKLQDVTIKLESSDSMNEEKRPEEASAVHTTISNHQINQLPIFEETAWNTTLKEPVLQEQLISSPQQRLAQILTNQTSVDSAILLSQQKIASAITSRIAGSPSGSISKLQTTEESDFHEGGRPHEFIRTMAGRSLGNDSEQVIEDESENQPSYLEAKEAANPRRFTDHETLINAMNRPALPLKAAPIQRSVSCNSLVQSIKDLGFSVWSKSEKKRNSDGISTSKNSTRCISVTSSSKVTAPLSVTLIPSEASNEVINFHQGKNGASTLDEKSTLEEYPWFHNVEANEGQLRLLNVGQDGTFLIRPSSRPTENIQNTMCIFFNGKVRNFHIRKKDDGRYVLGTKSNKSFSSIAEMIRHHKEIPVEILPHGATPLKPQPYRILLTETPPKLQKLFAVVK